MIPVLSLVTSVKDYLEVVHKLIEYDVGSNMNINYSELGGIITYFVISLKNGLLDFLSFSWLKNVWSLPVIIPDISSAMISEVSVLDGYFHNAFNFLDTPVSYGREGNSVVAGLEKFTIGVLNSIFLCLPTSTAHIITLRRFVMQGLEAGYIAGLGTIAGNLLWLASIILGWRFFVIPWLSLDIFRYILGFVLLVKYMWDSYNERRSVLEDVSKQKIFLLNFLLALTEQTSIYPFISNLSFSPEASLLESFPAASYSQFLWIHVAYLVGIAVGCFSLLQFTCWFWENPAFKIYMWMISSFKVSTSAYYKVLNFTFLYLTMISAIASIPYYGLDYTITNPLGYVNDDRIIQDKLVLETSFLGSKASDRNTRRNPGRHGRRERWKRRIRKYRTFDASLYDQGIYDLFTIEDLNYGFDRFWLRRKLRNHHVKFRFFPGPWMRSFKKQLAKPRLESYTGPRVEFFRILFEQVYHPSFHAYEAKTATGATGALRGLSQGNKNASDGQRAGAQKAQSRLSLLNAGIRKDFSIYAFSEGITSANASGPLGQAQRTNRVVRKNVIYEGSTLRKFVRKLDNRLKTAQIGLTLNSTNAAAPQERTNIYSKRWKQVFSKLSKREKLVTPKGRLDGLGTTAVVARRATPLQKQVSNEQILRYKNILAASKTSGAFGAVGQSQGIGEADFGVTLLHPLKFYLQQEAAFNRKLRYYTPSVYRKFSVENNAPYFRVMMRRFFYNYKPTNRWERTMKVASLRKARRKTTRIPRKLQLASGTDAVSQTLRYSTATANVQTPAGAQGRLGQEGVVAAPSGLPVLAEAYTGSDLNRLKKPTYGYSVVSKRASRYRYQIYKDVLQHWYYSPFNRLLLKMDVDSFIRRQPNSHFLTAKEENLLHLRRYLLSEHYNTLRWYTNMEHYRSMKTRLGGGTKSFSSRVYNQQFAGTFKKIRHLFAITPSQGNVVLKYDQPLYNEYPNTQQKPLVNTLVIHEELLGDTNSTQVVNSVKFPSEISQDLLAQSQQVVREYLLNARSVRESYIKTLLNENNYTTLTQFIYKGQKTRGDEPTTNERLFNTQEKQYLLTAKEQKEIEKRFGTKDALRKFIDDNNLMEDLYVTYLKKWKRRVNDQEALKSYLTRRIDKREKRKQKKEKHLLNKLKQLESSALRADGPGAAKQADPQSEFVTTGFQKSIYEGMLTLNNVDTKTVVAKRTTFAQPSNYKRFKLLDQTKKQQTLNELRLTTTQLTTILEKYKTMTNFAGVIPAKRTTFRNKVKTSISGSLTPIYNKITRTVSLLPSSIGALRATKLTNLLKPIKRKTLKNWRNKERVVGKQKRLRKEFKLLMKQSPASSPDRADSQRALIDRLNFNSFGTNIESRQKRDALVTTSSLGAPGPEDGTPKQRSFNSVAQRWDNNGTSLTGSQLDRTSSGWSSLFDAIVPKFKRKRAAQRHSRSRRNRGVFKKRSLNSSMKKDLKTLDDVLPYETKVALYNKINKTSRFTTQVSPSSAEDRNLVFDVKDLKQRKAKQRKQRYWKQKRSKFAQKRNKYRKRRRFSLGKIRQRSKQTYKIQNKVEIQNWWWKQFLPSIQASTDALWQIEKDKLIQQKLAELSPTEILERDRLITNGQNSLSEGRVLQIGNKDFKPLALPEAIRLTNNLNADKTKDFNLRSAAGGSPSGYGEAASIDSTNDNLSGSLATPDLLTVNQLYENLFLNKENAAVSGFKKFLVPNTSLPFYAGWDESLRKFVVTNRMLSRQDAGYQMKQFDSSTSIPNLKPLFSSPDATADEVVFTQAPLQGMNAATTLYWQIPFTTYDPDQFFALGMDGFSPIGWRKFLFRHSILKSWLSAKSNTVSEAIDFVDSGDNTDATSLVKFPKEISLSAPSGLNRVGSSANAVDGIVVPFNASAATPSLVAAVLAQSGAFTTTNSLFKKSDSGSTSLKVENKNLSRRLKKRYRRVKKHPRAPAWYPSGPLLNQVLPVHYIYVFYKRSRLPRDRYLKRRLLNTKTIQNSDVRDALFKASTSQWRSTTDFTLRKRLKPKRKYHLKRNFYSSNVVIPRRFKFIGSSAESLRWRPLSSTKINKSIAELVKEQKLMRTKQRNLSAKQQNPTLRVKQLKRRVQRQILRSVWRYRPRAGGFVWPGDYLKLELVKAPKLKLQTAGTGDVVSRTSDAGATTSKRKAKKKKKRALAEWQIQPKKYLYQKHNIKVLKKKLEKVSRSDSDKIRQKVKELNYIE